MPFIIVADSKSEEIERRNLEGAMVIGRSPECTLPVRDILLSRKHCVIERIGDAWVVADLGSKNGTLVNGEPISRHVLKDLDVVRIGRTRIVFRDAPFVSAPPDVKRSRQRPADPLEAMAGTLSGFRFTEEEEQAMDQRVLATFPRPKPHPPDPRAYQSERVQAMIADIASSAWDLTLMGIDRSRPATLPKPVISSIAAAPDKVAAVPVKGINPGFNRARTVTMLYIGLTMALASTSVWIISWSW